ncbi:hypothetical protein ERJ75_000293000 [Trypanosoma vivax]|nr:hypothetical protein ERJ75_000293000 [Trypanosoma vivax]
MQRRCPSTRRRYPCKASFCPVLDNTGKRGGRRGRQGAAVPACISPSRGAFSPVEVVPARAQARFPSSTAFPPCSAPTTDAGVSVYSAVFLFPPANSQVPRVSARSRSWPFVCPQKIMHPWLMPPHLSPAPASSAKPPRGAAILSFSSCSRRPCSERLFHKSRNRRDPSSHRPAQLPCLTFHSAPRFIRYFFISSVLQTLCLSLSGACLAARSRSPLVLLVPFFLRAARPSCVLFRLVPFCCALICLSAWPSCRSRAKSRAPRLAPAHGSGLSATWAAACVRVAGAFDPVGRTGFVLWPKAGPAAVRLRCAHRRRRVPWRRAALRVAGASAATFGAVPGRLAQRARAAACVVHRALCACGLASLECRHRAASCVLSFSVLKARRGKGVGATGASPTRQ